MSNEKGQSVAFIAAQKYDFPSMRYALEKDDFVLFRCDNSSRNIIEAAIENGASYTVKYLVEHHNWSVHRPNNASSAGNTPVHYASRKGQLEILKYFIEEAGGDVNVRNNVGDPPVFLAAEAPHMKIVKYLIDEGKVDLTSTTNDRNESILFAATKRGDLTLTRFLLEDKKIPLDVNWTNNFHQTLLYSAVRNRRQIGQPVITYLVENMHADVNIADDQNRTPLHVAAFANDYSLCRYLVEHGADVRAKDKYGYTPMENAAREELVHYFQELTRHDRNPRSIIMLPSPRRSITKHPLTLKSLGERREYVQGDVNGELNTFLTVANTMLRSFHYRRALLLLSPWEIVLSRVEPTAVEALDITLE